MKIMRSFFKKKKSGSGYQSREFPLQAVPGENGLRQQKRKWSLSRIKYLVSEKKRKKNEGYGRPVTRGKLLYRWVVLFLFITGAGWLVFSGGRIWVEKGLASLSFFQVAELGFSGCNSVSNEQLREQSQIILHQTSLMGMETAEIEARLQKNPWVSSVKVKRNWPSTVEIEIKEHVPVALLHSTASDPDQLYYINNKGVPFKSVTVGGNVDFPIITGLTEITDQDIKQKALNEVVLFLQKVNSNDPHLPAQAVSEIHVNPAGELVVYLVEYPFPIFFGDGNTKRKYEKLLRVLQALYKKQKGEEIISRVEYIRMDYFNDKVLVAQSESG